MSYARAGARRNIRSVMVQVYSYNFMNKKIHIFITGGTIDSIWDGKLDTAVVGQHSSLPEYFDKKQ